MNVLLYFGEQLRNVEKEFNLIICILRLVYIERHFKKPYIFLLLNDY